MIEFSGTLTRLTELAKEVPGSIKDVNLIPPTVRNKVISRRGFHHIGNIAKLTVSRAKTAKLQDHLTGRIKDLHPVIPRIADQNATVRRH